jgi:tetratricopeptide (TPR) repeat protein
MFGGPKIFDLYHGNAEELAYFQQFDDESNKENTQLTIHRRTNGQVMYLYLKHNFLTSTNRRNAFWGMAIAFNNEYIADVNTLCFLFDEVYNKILQERVLFEEISGNPTVQAKFLVPLFSDAEFEVKRIEDVVRKNIEKNFTKDILQIDTSFQEGRANVVRRMSYPESQSDSNSEIISALRAYRWVSLSPDYKTGDSDDLSVEKIKELKDNPKYIKDRVLEAFKQIAMSRENITINVDEIIAKYGGAINITLTEIEPYLSIHPDLENTMKEYRTLKSYINDLDKAWREKQGVPKPPILDTTVRDPNDPYQGGSKTLPPPPPYERNNWKGKIIGVGGVIILFAIVGLSVRFCSSKDTETPTQEPTSGTTSSPTQTVVMSRDVIKQKLQVMVEEALQLCKEGEYAESANAWKEYGAYQQQHDSIKGDAYSSWGVLVKEMENYANIKENYASHYSSAQNFEKQKKYDEAIKEYKICIDLLIALPDSQMTNNKKVCNEAIARCKKAKASAESTTSSVTIMVKQRNKDVKMDKGYVNVTPGQITVSVKKPLSNGKWECENQHIVIKEQNEEKATLQADGNDFWTCKLYYKVNGQTKETINFKRKELSK